MTGAELSLTELPTTDPLCVEEFHERFVRPERPVRIRGAIRHWPALGRWSPEDFAARFGEVRAGAYAMDGGHVALDRATGFRVVRLTLREYVEHLRDHGSKPRLYLRAKLGELPPELMREIETPTYCTARPALRRNLWFSGTGTITSLHFDLPHNFVAQVYGRKRFILFSRSETRNLYPRSWLSSVPHLSRVDPAGPDYATFPKLRRARGYTCTLEPGDTLFIPSRFWHHASSVTTSIGINFWWATPAVYPFIKLSDAYKRARGLNI